MSAAPQNLAGVRKQPMSRKELDYVFIDKYPSLTDLLQNGGVPGVRYALVSATRVGHFQTHLGYDLVARLPAITVRITKGAHAGDHAAFLMCSGRPIRGAQQGTSIRPYEADTVLDEATGLGPATPQKAPAKPKE